MAKVYFICGFIGSGKTTYSKELAEKSRAFRFCLDEWMIPLYGEHMEREMFDSRLATLENLFKASAIKLLDLNVSVIFDFGYWKKADRISAEEWANENGLDFEFVYLDVDYQECCKRAMARNSEADAQSYEITQEMLDMFWSWFEIPNNENLTIVSNK